MYLSLSSLELDGSGRPSYPLPSNDGNLEIFNQYMGFLGSCLEPLSIKFYDSITAVGLMTKTLYPAVAKVVTCYSPGE